jgi:hypothetical protein
MAASTLEKHLNGVASQSVSQRKDGGEATGQRRVGASSRCYTGRSPS